MSRRAVASYAWTGSWRTVRVVIDPVGTASWTIRLRRDVAAHLEAVRLIGEDLELRPPRFVPLEIRVEICAEPDVWREDLRFVVEQEFSTGWTADGRLGFFNLDAWTFGQALHRSAIEGRVHLVGVRHVVRVAMHAINARAGAANFIGARWVRRGDAGGEDPIISTRVDPLRDPGGRQCVPCVR